MSEIRIEAQINGRKIIDFTKLRVKENEKLEKLEIIFVFINLKQDTMKKMQP